MEFKYNISWNSNTMVHRTPLHFACKKGYFEIVQLLLSQPNIDIKCKTIQIQYFMKFKYKISWNSNTIFIKHHYILHVKKDILKLFNYYYLNQILISTVKLFKYNIS